MVNRMEFKRIIALTDYPCKIVKTAECPLINLIKLVKCNHIGIGIEIVKVCKYDTACISYLSIGFRKLLEDIIGNTHVNTVIT